MGKEKDTELRARIGQELMPSNENERTMSGVGYFAMWVGCAVIIATYALGGTGVQSINLIYVILAVIAANIFVGIFITLAGDIGVEHGIPFPVICRASFGPIGCALPTLVRAFIACGWLGIQTYYGATAMSYIVWSFTGFDSWMTCFYVFMAIQVINAAFGINAIDKFAKVAAPSIIVISLWIVFKLMGVAAEQDIDIWHSVLGPTGQMFTTAGVSFQAFMLVCFANMSFWSTNTCDTQSWTKYVDVPINERNWFKRNKKCIIAHCIALPMTQAFCVCIGGMATLALGNWNPIEALQTTASGPALLAMLILIIFAQWSTNVAGNMLPPAYIFMNVVTTLFKKNIKYPICVVLCGIIASVIQPWNIMDQFQAWLGLMGSSYGPLCGILLSDFYLLRKRRINVPELYKINGQYSGWHGVNLAGIIAFVLAFLCAFRTGDLSWGVGVIGGLVFYYVLAKFWWFRKYPQAEIESGFDDKYLGISNGNFWSDMEAPEM